MSEERCEAEDISLQRWEITRREWARLYLDGDGRLAEVNNPGEMWEDEVARRRFEMRDKVKGLIRSVVLVIDLSEPGLEPRDFGQHRGRVLINALKPFVTDFFDQSPISQMAILATYNETAYVLSPLCGAVELHLRCIDNLMTHRSEGWPSLQSSLDRATKILLSAPEYSTKEVLVVFGALNTSDSMPIDATIRKLRSSRVVVNVIGFGAGLYVLQRLAKETGGEYLVPMNEDHLSVLLRAQLEPPPWSHDYERLPMVKIGFVKKKMGQNLAFDVSELKTNPNAMPKEGGLSCPKCGMKVFVVPVHCPSCGLLLLTPLHVGRAMMQIRHADIFEHVPDFGPCASCLVEVTKDEDPQGMRKCGRCGSLFCRKCDQFIHETLHQCPLCLLSTDST